MAGDIADPVQQRASEVTNLRCGEWAIVMAPLPHQRITPFAVRRQNDSQQVSIRIVVIKASGVGVSERLRDLKPDVASAPTIFEPDIEKMRADRELHDDAGPVEKIAAIPNNAFLDAGEEALCVVIAERAEASAFPGPAKDRRLVAPLPVQRFERRNAG